MAIFLKQVLTLEFTTELLLFDKYSYLKIVMGLEITF